MLNALVTTPAPANATIPAIPSAITPTVSMSLVPHVPWLLWQPAVPSCSNQPHASWLGPTCSPLASKFKPPFLFCSPALQAYPELFSFLNSTQNTQEGFSECCTVSLQWLEHAEHAIQTF